MQQCQRKNKKVGGVGRRLEVATARDLLPFMAIFQQTLSDALIPRTSADSQNYLLALYIQKEEKEEKFRRRRNFR